MIKQILFLLVLCFSTNVTVADTSQAKYGSSPSKEESAGAFSGAILGGVVGGPVGVVVGASIGALVGDGWNARGQVNDLQSSLHSTQLQLARAEEELEIVEEAHDVAQTELTQYRNLSAQVTPAFLATQLNVLCCDGTLVSIHFKTGSSAIESHYEEQLESIAKIVKQVANAKVEITGYADRNGNANRNLVLSQKRSEEVRAFFTKNGIDNASITTVAYGDTRPVNLTRSFESDFFDRRVIVRINASRQAMLSKTSDNK